MADPTLQGLDNTLRVTRTEMSGLEARIETLEERASIYITNAELQTSLSDINDNISDINTTINTIETQLQRVVLPTDTRYYLQESEISDFRNNFRQLRALMAELERSRAAFIRLASRYNLTNSQT